MPWTAKQHLWKSKAKEGHQFSRGGPSNRQKKNDVKITSLPTLFHVQSTLDKMAGLDYWPKVALVLALKKKGKYPWVGTLLIYM